jgi:hypothetical protein
MKAKLFSAMLFASMLLVVASAQAQYGPSPGMYGGMGPGMMPPGAGPMRGPGPGMQMAYVQPNPDQAGMGPGPMPMGAGPMNAAGPMGQYGGCNGDSCGGGNSCEGGQGCGNSCGCGDCSCEFRCGWYGGGELLWFRPYFEHNTAFSLETDTTLGNGVSNAAFSSTPFRYDFDIAPRFFVGWEDDCGFGYRGRYWQYKQDANQIVATSPFDDQAGATFNILLPDDFANFSGLRQIVGLPGDIFTINSSLELHTIDTEFTQRFKWCCNDVQFGFGARLLRMVQRYDAEVVKNQNNFGGDFYRHQLKQEGAGPTVAFDLRHPVGCYGLSLVATNRWITK